MIAQTLAMVLMVAPAPQGTAERSASAEQPRQQIALTIDHSALLEHQDAPLAEETATFLQEDSTKALQKDHGFEVVTDKDVQAIIVRLAWVDYSESIYRLTVLTQRPGEQPTVVETFDCACIDSGVIESVLLRFPKALEQLAQEPESSVTPAKEEEPEIGLPEPEPAATGDEADDRTAAPIGLVGMSGIVFAGGGLGALGFGISRLAKGEERGQDGADEESGQLLDFRPQGRAWLGIGLSAAAVGSAMLIVDLTVLRRRRAARLAFSPVLRPQTAGIAFQGRF